MATVDRTKKKTAPPGIKFPERLDSKRYIKIKVFDTTKDDPNKVLAATTGFGVNVLGQAFKKTNTDTIKKILDDKVDFNTVIGELGGGLSELVGEGKVYAEEVLGEMTKSWDALTAQWEGVGNPSLSKHEFKEIIFLPLPNEITESLQHSYSDQPGLIQGLPVIGAAAEKLAEGVTTISNHVSKATGTQALSYNKNKLAKFDESAFRKISFSWNLIPNNKSESTAIQTIITKLKAYSSPQAVAGKMLLRAPFFCQLEFPNKYLDKALQFKEVVIESIEVNYSVSGNMETFQDDMPKTMSLSINFQDREPKTLQDWGSGVDAKGYEGKLKPTITATEAPSGAGTVEAKKEET